MSAPSDHEWASRPGPVYGWRVWTCSRCLYEYSASRHDPPPTPGDLIAHRDGRRDVMLNCAERVVLGVHES